MKPEDQISDALLGVPRDERERVMEGMNRTLWALTCRLRKENKKLKAMVGRKPKARPVSARGRAEQAFRKAGR